jgi:hypothetical protein
MKMVVAFSLLVDVSVHGGILTMAVVDGGKSWLPLIIIIIIKHIPLSIGHHLSTEKIKNPL